MEIDAGVVRPFLRGRMHQLALLVSVVGLVLLVRSASTPRAVVAAWKKFFGLDMDYLGAIAYDDSAWQTVRKRRPLLVDAAGSAASSNVTSVAEALVALDRAACRFGSSREELAIALADDAAAAAYEREHGVDPRSAGGLLGGVVGF